MWPWQFCMGFLWSAVTFSALPRAQEQPFVRAQPERTVVEFGSSVVVNCSTTCQRPISANLETNLETEVVGEGPTWRAFRLLNISSWFVAPLCFFDCPGSRDMRPLRVPFTVYRLPELVELDPVPVVEVGENYTLTCRVSNVAPIRNLSVTFFKGGEELHTYTFEDHSAPVADNVVVNHTVAARKPVFEEEISCRAVLNLGPQRPGFEKASFSQTLNIMGYIGFYLAIVSTALLAMLLMATSIYLGYARKQENKPRHKELGRASHKDS
ncbi:intercellular adhesion molecule 4 [Paroedura picta]|uniref:intercellular adhesion molecule 4 n=1 Tax=Paroedura picta TaxID=143630 RepID=UPI004056BD34